MWTAVELGAFLVAARGQRRYPALHLAAHTGMRQGEIVGLKWTDMDRSRAGYLCDERCSASPDDPSSSTSRPAPVDAASTSTPPPSTSSTSGAADFASTTCRTVPTTGCSATPPVGTLNPESLTPAVRPNRAPRRRPAHPLPRRPPHPRLAPRRQRRPHQGAHRTPRSSPPGLHDAHLPAPAPRHERRSRRPVRHPRRRREPVDVYRLRFDESPGHHLCRR
jgi:hypothetical protein